MSDRTASTSQHSSVVLNKVCIGSRVVTDCLQLASLEAACADGESICKTCHKIDFGYLLRNPKLHHEDSIWSHDYYSVRYSTGCKLCNLLFQGTSSHDLGKIFELNSFADHEMDDVELKIRNQTAFCPVNLIPLPVDNFRSLNDPVFCRLASEVSQNVKCAQLVQKIWDYDKARLWLEVCLRCHGPACKPDSLAIPAMNLIDCENMVIVTAAPEMPWLALSYVWGVNQQTENPVGYRAGSSLSLVEIPRTIRDAIFVTLQLGYRFLWVDEYCIDQNDEIHRKDQIGKMDRIYRGANLTIVAAAGIDKMCGLPGVGLTARKEENVVHARGVIVFPQSILPHIETRQSKWFTRAW